MNNFIKALQNILIAVNGDPRSGKSTLIQSIAESYTNLGYTVELISIGKMVKEKAASSGLSITDYNKQCENKKNLDKEIDNYIIEQAKAALAQPASSKVFIFDSRKAYALIDENEKDENRVFRLRVSVDALIAGQRAYQAGLEAKAKQERGEELTEKVEIFDSVEAATIKTRERQLSEIKRFPGLSDSENYDMVINTSFVHKDKMKDIAKYIVACQQYKYQEIYFAKLWRSPKTFFPTCANINYKQIVEILQKAIKGFEIFTPDAPAFSLRVDSHYFLYTEHMRVLAALDSEVPIIPYEIIAKDDEQINSSGVYGRMFESFQTARQVSQMLTPADYYKWEDAVVSDEGFKFHTYPWLPISELWRKIKQMKKDANLPPAPEPRKKKKKFRRCG